MTRIDSSLYEESYQQLLTSTTDSFIGIKFIGTQAKENFLEIICPCGVKVSYALNKVPEVDTKHPCDHPDHWTVRYSEVGDN